MVNPVAEYRKLTEVINAAIEKDIYVIIDWHAHEPHPEEAKRFFHQVIQDFPECHNLIFETWNEPEQNDWNRDIKPYHEYIIPTIRQQTQNLIVAGTRQWSQRVDEAARDPLQGENIAYAFHFYAGTHGDNELKYLKDAIELKKPIFVTEWGTCKSNGDGEFDEIKSRGWLSFLEENHISHVNWAANDKEEMASAFEKFSDEETNINWSGKAITRSGSFVKDWIANHGGGAT